jgi:DNA-binding MarR family transcriptional regulator
MARRRIPLGVLVRVNPSRARHALVIAYRGTRGNASAVARMLGVDHSTVLRWVERLNMADEIERVRGA